MPGHQSFYERAAGHLGFMLDNADMIYPLFLSVAVFVVVLMFKRVRDRLKEPLTLVAFLGVFLLWAALIPWGALWLDAMDVRNFSPKWAGWPVAVVLFGWPVVAAALIIRARGARIASAVYVMSNAPGWFLGCFVCAMAVSGDWI
jgi:hypothetical protein